MEVEGIGRMERESGGRAGREAGAGHGLRELNGRSRGQRSGAEKEMRNQMATAELGAAVLEVSLLPECLPWNFPA